MVVWVVVNKFFMKKTLLILAFLTLCHISYSQEDRNFSAGIPKDLSEQEFLKATELYLQLTQTDAYKAERKAEFTFYRKFPRGANFESFLKEEDYVKWLSENLASTKFKTIEEAITMRREIIEKKKKFIDDNAKIFDLVKRANAKQLLVIIAPELRPAELTD